MSFRRLLSLTLLATALVPLASLRGADVNEPQEGLLLLRNGYVLQGRVSRVGERYFVLTTTGEIRVPVEQAETFCLNLDEAYRVKRAAIDPESDEDRRALAAWCLRHDLTRRAADELSAAERLRPNHPTTRRLQQRLELALRPPPEPAAPAKANPSRPSAAELARAIESLPRGALESFTHHIQPLLMNRCVSCHSRPGQRTFQLRRPPRGRPADHRITQANLFATLQYVDREQPDRSKLLALALKPHGGSQKAVLVDRKQSQYRLLAGWVHGVARATISGDSVSSSAASKPKTVSPAGGPLLQVIDRPEDGRGVKTAESDLRPQRGQAVVTPLLTQPPAERRPQHAAAGLFVPRDAFDPEIFNRRYFSKPAKKSPRHPVAGKSVRGDRRIEIGVGRRPSSRPSQPQRPSGLQRPDTVPGRQDR